MPRRGTGPRLAWRRGAYVIRWTEDGGTRERATGETSRERAEAAFADWLGQRRTIPDRYADPLIADLLGDYALEHGAAMAPDTRDYTAYAIDRLLDFWSGQHLGQINKASCLAYALARREPRRQTQERTGRDPLTRIIPGAGDGTIRRELTVLTAALNHAHAAGRIAAVPHIHKPAPPPGRERWLTRDEAARLIRAARAEPQARAYLPLFILLGLYGGQRKSAILSLRWSQIDLDRAQIRWLKPGERQTSKRRPANPIPRRLLTFLRLARRRGTDLGPVLHIDGAPIANIRRSFATAALRAGLDPHEVTPHILRHTCGTWLAQAGTDLWQVAGYLGHGQDRTTALYTHHHPDHMRDAIRALDAGPRR